MQKTVARFKWNEKQEIRKLQKEKLRNFYLHTITAELSPKYNLFWQEAPVETQCSGLYSENISEQHIIGKRN